MSNIVALSDLTSATMRIMKIFRTETPSLERKMILTSTLECIDEIVRYSSKHNLEIDPMLLDALDELIRNESLSEKDRNRFIEYITNYAVEIQKKVNEK